MSRAISFGRNEELTIFVFSGAESTTRTRRKLLISKETGDGSKRRRKKKVE
jgi:hypothetical protein